MNAVSARDFPAGRWRARWIWYQAPARAALAGLPFPVVGAESASFGCFRRCFRLDAAPARVPARISADSRYRLWLNGHELAHGPIRCNARRLHYDMIDLAPHLRPGRNAIAVLARFYKDATPWWAPANPGALQLGAGSLVFEARLADDRWLVSDASWRARRGEGWQEIAGARGIGGMAPESLDARALPTGWREADFDDADWAPAIELAANSIGFVGRHEPPSYPYGALRPRSIASLSGELRSSRPIRLASGPRPADKPHPFEQVLHDAAQLERDDLPGTNGGAIELEARADRAHLLSFDFGEVVCGSVLLEVEAPAGARFDLAAAEFASADGRLAPDGERSGLRYIARGHDDRFESFDPMGLRYAGVSVRADSSVKIKHVSVRERLYPCAPGASFSCSEAVLEQIFRVGRRTVTLDSHDAYLDCPTREQRGWTGDFVVHQMVDLATNPDWRLAAWNVEMVASPRPDGMLPMAAGGDIEHHDPTYIPDWALHWVRALHNVYRYTGDREQVSRMMPVAEGVLRWFEPFVAEDGLLCDVTGWVIIDWSSVTTAGRSSVLNALWARGLLDFAELAEWLGDAGRAAWARAAHARVAAAFERFWDPERLLYVDNIERGVRGRTTSEHAQAAPIVGGLAPAARLPRLVELLVDARRRVHATWSRPSGDARFPQQGERGVGGPYLMMGPGEPWWDVETQLVAAQPFFRYVVHDALALAGRADLIARQCLDWAELFSRSETSWSETWYGGTISHGWSATPTRDLLTRTLGVTPAEPGFSRARVAPRPGVLTWLRGSVAHPLGWIRVELDEQALEVDCPVPFDLDLEGQPARAYPAGRHRVARL